MFRNLFKIAGQSPRFSRNLSSALKYETLSVTFPKPFVCHVEFNRPESYNSFTHTMWIEIGECFKHLSTDEDTRVIVVSAAGKHFTAGLDFNDVMKLGQKMAGVEDVGRRAKIVEESLVLYQNSLSSLEQCVKPVIACVHSACIGAGVDFIAAADMRICSKDAWFQVKEVGIGMAADVGTLQRLPKAIGNQSLVRELCFTARKMQSDEALNCGLVGHVRNTKNEALQKAFEIAETISELSPIAVQTTKKSLVYSQSRTNEDGLNHIKEMNRFLLQSEDFLNAVVAQQTKDKPVFAKL